MTTPLTITPGSVRSTVTKPVPERSTWAYEAYLVDETGAAIEPEDLLVLTLTVYVNNAAKSLVNGADHVSILNADRGTVAAGGKLTIVFEAEDSQIVTPARTLEPHIALLEYAWVSGENAHEVEWMVSNMSRRA